MIRRTILTAALFIAAIPAGAIAQPADELFGPIGDDEVRFAAVGDTGTGGSDQMKVAERLEAVRNSTGFTTLLFLGDNIYPSGSPSDIEDKFLKPYSDLFLAGVTLRGVIGNHDARSRHGVLLQQMIFGMGRDTFYSFTEGDGTVAFFALDSPLLVSGKSPDSASRQVEWLKKELDGSGARWKIVLLHHPIYSSAEKHGTGSDDEHEMDGLRELLEPLFTEHGVDVVLSGHDHVYERIIPQKGVHYFVTGAGAKLRKGDLDPASPLTAAGNDRVRSFVVFAATYSELRFRAVAVNGEILDSGSIPN
ncbi:MAG: metallophosphoesterase [Acidobacteriota bacterium]|nr:MAG: metallophosphoesterase [Acidobacteriota bacterium]